ncbi:uncharacterized protein TNCV_4796701 [Trichonephila clavipes]|nr:uncharacterized protein TNCV_4796701 [Trichonephila clavipes]
MATLPDCPVRWLKYGNPKTGQAKKSGEKWTSFIFALLQHVELTLLIVAAVAEWYRYRTVACLVTSSSPVPLKTRRVGQRCTINLSRAETSSRWCGVELGEGASSGVVPSLDHGSKLRGPSPKALV